MTDNNVNTDLPGWDDSEALEKMNSEQFSDFVFKKLESEPPQLTTSGMKSIEKALVDLGIARRIALAFLTKPWAETSEAAANDREFAEVLADSCKCIDPEPYRELADLLSSAKIRMEAALMGREDYASLMDKGGDS